MKTLEYIIIILAKCMQFSQNINDTKTIGTFVGTEKIRVRLRVRLEIFCWVVVKVLAQIENFENSGI